MPDALKILGQSSGSTGSNVDIYTVPALTSATVSTITVCNRGNTSTSFRVSVALGGEVDATKQYIYYDVPIDAYETFATTIGITLATSDIIRGYAANANLSFNIFGIEVT